MSNLNNLLTREAAIITELSELDSNRAGGRPDSGGGALSVQHMAYKRSLYEELELIQAQLERFDGPVEKEHYGTV